MLRVYASITIDAHVTRSRTHCDIVEHGHCTYSLTFESVWELSRKRKAETEADGENRATADSQQSRLMLANVSESWRRRKEQTISDGALASPHVVTSSSTIQDTEVAG
jgi:hypothetical protein